MCIVVLRTFKNVQQVQSLSPKTQKLKTKGRLTLKSHGPPPHQKIQRVRKVQNGRPYLSSKKISDGQLEEGHGASSPPCSVRTSGCIILTQNQ